MTHQDMGMLTESASIRSGGEIKKDLTKPFDQPGEWRERRLRHLKGALRLIESLEERELSEREVDLQIEVETLKKRIADLQESVNTAKKQSFKDTIQNKDLASADPNAVRDSE